MNSKMAINTYLIGSKNKINQQNRNRIIDKENILMVAKWEGGWGNGRKSEGIKKCKLVVTE